MPQNINIMRRLEGGGNLWNTDGISTAFTLIGSVLLAYVLQRNGLALRHSAPVIDI
jgi:hypothetical protein